MTSSDFSSEPVRVPLSHQSPLFPWYFLHVGGRRGCREPRSASQRSSPTPGPEASSLTCVQKVWPGAPQRCCLPFSERASERTTDYPFCLLPHGGPEHEFSIFYNTVWTGSSGGGWCLPGLSSGTLPATLSSCVLRPQTLPLFSAGPCLPAQNDCPQATLSPASALSPSSHELPCVLGFWSFRPPGTPRLFL